MDHYLAIIQTILDRCENDNTSPDIHDMEIIKIGNYIPKFIDNMFGRENMISEGSTISENDTICINIKYHKIGEVFNYKVGMSEMTLRVDKCDRCSGCAFENYIYDCVKSGCLGCEREDGESVRYTIVNT